MSSLLRAEKLTRRFGETLAVDHASLEIGRGELVGVTGRSGSGKTTLLSLLCGLLRPDEGRLWFDQAELTGSSNAKWARVRLEMMGFVFQNFLLEPHRTARQNVSLPLLLLGRSVADAGRAAGQALEAVGLSELADRPTAKMSGGQRQRVAFARAIVANPPLVLADEPTGNLDAETARSLLTLTRELREDLGTSFLLVTHDPLMDEYVDRSYVIEDGKLLQANPAAKILPE